MLPPPSKSRPMNCSCNSWSSGKPMLCFTARCFMSLRCSTSSAVPPSNSPSSVPEASPKTLCLGRSRRGSACGCTDSSVTGPPTAWWVLQPQVSNMSKRQNCATGLCTRSASNCVTLIFPSCSRSHSRNKSRWSIASISATSAPLAGLEQSRGMLWWSCLKNAVKSSKLMVGLPFGLSACHAFSMLPKSFTRDCEKIRMSSP
mmetsp:Transcript_150309/g.483036  ORF Transcript_150309/g.483036 Transcript_150309/m.483036 type:complete len:202 (-) Transcript_150309:1598-2203(-)